MKPYLPVAFLRIAIAVILILVCNQSFLLAQNTDLPAPTPNLMSAPAGTYVIAMDNTLQANPGYFNMKAYGLAVRILNAQRALHWVIRAGKPKDGIDFTANATRVFPASAPALSRDFKAGPLLVFPRDSAGVTALINAFNNAQPVAERVNVYQLTAPAMVDVRYILTQRPKAVVLNDGNNEKIHAEYYELAAIDSPANFSVASAANLISQCYTFASEPHSNTTGPTIGHIKAYVQAGGNFLAQCEAITTYENETNGRFHTTNGIKKENGNPSSAFPNPDLSFSQYEGQFNSQLIGGSVKNWKLETGSSYINNHHKHQSGGLPTDSNLVSQSVAKLGTGRGHLVFYTGGHDYSKNTGIDYLNGMRSFFNAFLTPSGLTQCDFLRFDNDIVVTKTGPGNSCVGQTDTFRVVVKNNGPTQTNSAPVVLQDIFPSAGFGIVSASVTSGSFNQATGVWTIGTMANQQSDTLRIIATATTTGSFTNTAYLNQDIHDYNNMNDTARVSVVVSGSDSTFLARGVGCGSYTLPWGPDVNISGTYTNTLTGANGCDSVVVMEVQINEVNIATSITPVLCYGGTTGSVSASPTGGTSPYLYSWSSGGTTATVTDLPAGSYTVTVTDSAGCSETVIAILSQPSSPVGLSTTQIDVLCNGTSTGSIDLTSDGGTGPYTYQWSNGATTEDISGLPAGTYTVTVNDANGSAGGCAATASVTLAESPALIPAAVKADVSCNGGLTGSIDLDVNGGVSPYNYAWSNGSTTQDISNLGAGTYTVTVTDDNGCTANLSETINEPTSPLDLSTSQQNVFCNGASAGDIDLTVTGGTAPYSFTWSNGAVTEDIMALAAGTYTVTVNDANGNSGTCSATATVVITEPAPFLVNPAYTDVLCAGGTTDVQVFAIGGTPPYVGTGIYTVPAGVHVYELSDANGCTATATLTVNEPSVLTADALVTGTGCSGGSVTVTANGGTAPYTGTGIFSGLSTGPHTFNVTDANGCTATVTANITAGSSIKITANATAILCHGGQSEVTVTASGGVAPYTGTGKFQVGAGFHTFVVTDAKGCADSVTIVITEPKKLMAFSAVYQACNGKTATVTVTASGGIGPYTGTGAFTVGSGTYSYTVTDANGCTAVTSVKVTISPPLMVSASTTPILCHGGMATVTITATGGTAPYYDTGIFSYPAGIHQLVVKDAKGCTASTTLNITEPATLTATATYQADCSGKSGTVTVNATGGTAPYTGTGNFNVGSGTYNFSVTDANGCTAVATVKVSVAPVLVMYATATPVLCNGGTSQVTVTASGGTTPYTGTGTFVQSAGTYSYLVTDANGCTADTTLTITEPSALSVAAVYKPDCDGKKGVVTVTASGGTAPYTGTGIFNVGPGTYSYTVTDANGCTAIASVKVSAFTPLVVSASAMPLLCHGTSSTVTVTATGGTPPYSGTGSFSQLAGTTTYSVIDANGCIATTQVSLSQPDLLTVTATSDKSSGDITATVTGGTAPYLYMWTPGNQTTASINVKVSGIYEVEVTDANGCVATTTVIQVLNMPCEGFRTQRQSDWGAMPVAGNSAAYMQQHFATAFPAPQHLTIGCNQKLRLSSWEAVRDFLPSGNFSGMLSAGLLVDPGSSYDNAFAGELVALLLSVRFDELDQGFSTSNYSLADLIIASGTFTGWTVQQVIDEANGKIGGCSSSYSISDLQQTLMAINENYVDGKVNKGFLVCPNAINKSITTPPPAGISATAFPNPFTRSTTIQFGTAADFPDGTSLRLEVYSADGRLVAKLFDEPVSGGEVRNVEWMAPGLEEGIYFYHIYGGGKMVTGRIMHANE